jgi:hypothetical protein
VAVTSGITLGGDSKRGLIGEKSTINLPKQPGFALGIKYELTPNRWWPVGETGALRIYPYFIKKSQISVKWRESEGET